MVSALLLLFFVAAPGEVSAPMRAEGVTTSVRPLAGAADVAGLCQRLVPAERLRPKGDALEQGESRARQEADREEALAARYEITVRPARLAFAPYDGPEEELEVAEPATLRLEGGAAVLFATEDRSLPVHVNAAVARRILAARAAGRLGLRLLFDVPDEAVCTVGRRGKQVTLGIEPVEWTWLDGESALAWGGVAADRPAVTVALGAVPAVDVGEPIAGPSEARRAVLARRADLVACYKEQLKSDPALDGVVVVDLGPKVSVAADSTGSAEMARCVERSLAALVGSAAASVPIRFELSTPGSSAGRGAAAADAGELAVPGSKGARESGSE
ncbi:MAG TPA: hypothetical protein VFG59_11995 [Anaeromyxobacter sp.]|nr:hypothetical protein [Anaeromyxobacter sp.]